MTAARVVCVGVATLDAIVVVDRVPGRDERVPGLDGRLSGGGVAATAAVALARLGVPVAFAGRVGDVREVDGELEVEIRRRTPPPTPSPEGAGLQLPSL